MSQLLKQLKILRKMRKALIVGVDYYEKVDSLYGCVNDAFSVKNALDRNTNNGLRNFTSKLLTSTGKHQTIDKRQLKESILELFKDDNTIALLYFSGHGYIESNGGYLVTSECSNGDDGFHMGELLNIVNSSPAKNKVVILDCCHAGSFGKESGSITNASVIGEGVTILAASSETQYALEEDGAGVFTSLFIDALDGAAANLLGNITLGSIYAHIDQSLGPWDQRPIFKTNIKQFISLRDVTPSICLNDLRMITELFPSKETEHKLDPSYELDSTTPQKENTDKFSILQKLNRVNLVVPVGAEHMYYAAMDNKSCKLTVLGEHYWKLIKEDRI